MKDKIEAVLKDKSTWIGAGVGAIVTFAAYKIVGKIKSGK